MSQTRLKEIANELELLKGKMINLVQDLNSLHGELVQLITPSIILKPKPNVVYQHSDFEYIESNFHWCVDDVIDVVDKGVVIKLIRFVNKVTGEVQTLNPKADASKFYRFAMANSVSSSNAVLLDPIKTVTLCKLFSSFKGYYLIVNSSLLLIKLGSNGFIALENQPNMPLSQVIADIKALGINEYDSTPYTIHPLLNPFYINTIVDKRITLGNGLYYDFKTNQEVIDHVNSHVLKRPTNQLFKKLEKLDMCNLYELRYLDNQLHHQSLFIISTNTDIEYYGYHTWRLTQSEYKEIKARLRTTESLTVNVIDYVK